MLKPGVDGKAKIVFEAGCGNLVAGPQGGPPSIPVAGTLTAQAHVPAPRRARGQALLNRAATDACPLYTRRASGGRAWARRLLIPHP